MASMDIKKDFEELVQAHENPLEVNRWLILSFSGLIVGAEYLVTLYFWCPEERPVETQILAADTDKVLKDFKFNVGRQLNEAGGDQWLEKRYKLDETRHNGSAKFKVGLQAGKEHPFFNIYAAPLKLSRDKRRELVAAGCCPECGKPGYWHTMAMLCPVHGRFLG